MNQFKSKNILITGGLGFIGSNLAVDLVGCGANVTIIDNNKNLYGANIFNIAPIEKDCEIIIEDICNKDIINASVKNKDYIFHLAGQLGHLESMEKPHDDLSMNIQGSLNLLEACKKHNLNTKILYTSTRQIYGRPIDLPVYETHPISPVDVNGVNKFSAEMYFQLYQKVYGIQSTILRLTNTYGPRIRIKDARQMFMGIWIKCILEKKPITIFGDGTQMRDFTFVDDVVFAMKESVINKNSLGDIFNLGGEKASLIELAMLFKELRNDTVLQFVEFPSALKAIDIGDFFSSYNKIKETIGWEPKFSLKEGLNLTLKYYEEHFNHYINN